MKDSAKGQRPEATPSPSAGETPADALDAAMRWDARHIFVTADVESMARALLAAPKPEGWRTMDSAPKDGTEIIVGGKGYAYGAMWLNDDWFVMDSDGSVTELVEPPTHWQPLPEAPK